MSFILILIGIFLIVRGSIKSIGKSILPDEDHEFTPYKNDSPTIIHNHITEQHLHITKEDLQSLKDSKPNT